MMHLVLLLLFSINAFAQSFVYDERKVVKLPSLEKFQPVNTAPQKIQEVIKRQIKEPESKFSPDESHWHALITIGSSAQDIESNLKIRGADRDVRNGVFDETPKSSESLFYGLGYEFFSSYNFFSFYASVNFNVLNFNSSQKYNGYSYGGYYAFSHQYTYYEDVVEYRKLEGEFYNKIVGDAKPVISYEPITDPATTDPATTAVPAELYLKVVGDAQPVITYEKVDGQDYYTQVTKDPEPVVSYVKVSEPDGTASTLYRQVIGDPQPEITYQKSEIEHYEKIVNEDQQFDVETVRNQGRESFGYETTQEISNVYLLTTHIGFSLMNTVVLYGILGMGVLDMKTTEQESNFDKNNTVHSEFTKGVVFGFGGKIVFDSFDIFVNIMEMQHSQNFRYDAPDVEKYQDVLETGKMDKDGNAVISRSSIERSFYNEVESQIHSTIIMTGISIRF